MCVECFEISVAAFPVGVVLQLLFGIALCVECSIAELEFEAVVNSLIISDMTLPQLVVSIVYEMPCVIRSLFDIPCALVDGMLVETVETGGIYEIYGSFRCSANQ